MGRLLALLVTVAGVFAMHGLADHGTAHHGGSVVAAAESGATSLMSVDPASDPEAQGGHQAPSQDDANLGLVGLCLAVLVIGLMLTAVWLLLEAARMKWRIPSAFMATGFVPRARDPVSPSHLMLSIQRC
jgi:hypothetical protein